MTSDAGLDHARPAGLWLAGLIGGLQGLLDRINQVLIVLSALATAVAGGVLTWEIAGRYFFKIPSDWQDESSIFLLVGATFLSAGWIQRHRGHIGIDALQHILPAAAEQVRRFLADLVSLAFCGFFCWRCWKLLLEAIEDDQTSGSAWGPPLWIPYGLMAVGMSILVIQILLQVAAQLVPAARR